jgi:predicted DNA binding CopG/RHH family protein
MKKSTIDLGYPTEARGRIPSFRSLEEEAQFWDTHDIVDYAGDAPARRVTRAAELGKRLTIRLDEGDSAAIEQRARRLGIGPSTLIRIWIKERLSREAS